MAVADQQKVTISLVGDAENLKRSLADGLKAFNGFVTGTDKGKRSVKDLGNVMEETARKSRKTAADAGRYSAELKGVATAADVAVRQLRILNAETGKFEKLVRNSGGGGGARPPVNPPRPPSPSPSPGRGGGFGIGGIAQAASLAGGGVGQIGGLAGAVGSFAAPLAAAAVGFIALSGAISGTAKAIDSAANIQTLQTSFKVLIGSAGEAQRAIQSLQVFANETPLEMPEVAASARMLLAYGFSAKEVQKELRMLGDVSSGTGQRIEDIAYLYGTARVQGRLFQMDINQFTNRGIPIISELAKVMGVAEAQVRTLTEAGQIGFPEVQAAFQNMTGEGGKFKDMMLEQSKTWNGAISNMRGNIDMLFQAFGQPIIEELTPTMTALADKVLELVPMMSQMGGISMDIANRIGAAADAMARFMAATNPTAYGLKKWAESSAVTARADRAATGNSQDSQDIGEISSMSDKEAMAKRLKGKLEDVKRLQRDPSASAAMLSALGMERQGIENNIRSLDRLSDATVKTRAVQKEAADQAKRDAQEEVKDEKKDAKDTAKEQKGLVTKRENAVEKSDRAMNAMAVKSEDTPAGKKDQIFSQARESIEGGMVKRDVGKGDLDAEIKRLTNLQKIGNASTTVAEIDALETLLELRKELVAIEGQEEKEAAKKTKAMAKSGAETANQIALLRVQATGDKNAIKAAEDKARIEELTAKFTEDGFSPSEAKAKAEGLAGAERDKKNFDESKTKTTALKDVNNQAQLLAARISGNPESVRQVEFQQRKEELTKQLTDAGVSQPEADAKANQVAGLELQAKRREAQGNGVTGDQNREIGAGGNAAGGGDPMLSEAQQQTGLLEKLVGNTTPEATGGIAPGGGASVPLFGSQTPEGGSSGNLAVFGEMLGFLKEIAANTRGGGKPTTGGGGLTAEFA